MHLCLSSYFDSTKTSFQQVQKDLQGKFNVGKYRLRYSFAILLRLTYFVSSLFRFVFTIVHVYLPAKPDLDLKQYKSIHRIFYSQMLSGNLLYTILYDCYKIKGYM